MKIPLFKKLLFWTILILLPVAIIFIIGELVLRFQDPTQFRSIKSIFSSPPPSNYVFDPNFGIKPKDSLYFLKGREVSELEGKEIIFALGDSFTKAHTGVSDDDAFYIKTERLLNSKPKREKFLLHFGVSGYCEQHYLKLIKKYAPIFKPSAILVQVYLGNDVGENSGLIKRGLNNEGIRTTKYIEGSDITETDRIENKSKLSKENKIPFGRKVYLWIRAKSYAVNWLEDRIQVLFWKMKGISAKEDESGPNPLQKVSTFPHLFNLMNVYGSEQINKAWNITADIVKEIKQEADKYDARLYFIIVPHELQVNNLAWEEKVVKPYKLDKNEWDRRLPNKKFKLILDSLNIDYVDVTQRFDSAINLSQDTLYFGHFNTKGHSIVANEIYNLLKDR